MREPTSEFKMLFAKAEEMNVSEIYECRPNNIFCLIEKIESFLYSLSKDKEEKLEKYIKLCKDLEQKKSLNELKDFFDKLNNMSLEIAKKNVKKIIEENEEYSFNLTM